MIRGILWSLGSSFCLLLLFSEFAGCRRITPFYGVFEDVGEARRYLDSGGDPNAVVADGGDKSKRTLLHKAAIYSSADVVQVLLAGGANPNAVDAAGWTPIVNAFTTERGKDRLDVIKLLLPVSDLDIKDHNGKTVLDLANESGALEGINALQEFIKLREAEKKGSEETESGHPLERGSTGMGAGDIS